MKRLDLTSVEPVGGNHSFDHLTVSGNTYFSSRIGSEDQIEFIKDLNIALVIDLKNTGESDFDEKSKLEELGIGYQSFSISNLEDLDFLDVRRFGDIFEEHSGSILITCMSGNRVGGIMALYAYLICGHAKERSLKFGKDVGMTKESIIESVNKILL